MRNKLNILSITPYPLFPANSGGQKKTFGFLEALGKIHNLTCLTSSDSLKEKDISFEVLPILNPTKLRYIDILSIKSIFYICKKKEIDLIIIDQPFLSWLAFIISKFLGINFIIHSHNIETLRFKSFRKWWAKYLFYYERWAFKKAWKIIFISKEDGKLAQLKMGVEDKKILIAPYGIWQSEIPKLELDFIKEIKTKHNIAITDKLLMFFGVLSYQPNIEAVELILNKIEPQLKKSDNLSYKILICGKGLPESLEKLINQNPNILYLGFIKDIDKFTKAVDVVLNPVVSGGGMKTKVIEALGFNKTVISTYSGAIGINKEVCGEKLLISEDNDWDAFSKNISLAIESDKNIPDSFYNTYNLEKINEKIQSEFIEIKKT